MIIMVLNQDCVRDILLAVEKCPFNQTLDIGKLAVQLPDYDEETIWYACLKMGEGGLLEIETLPIMRSVMPEIKQITCLTYQGHELLNSVRDGKRWSAIKTCGTAVRNYSLSAIGKISEGMTLAAINAYLDGKKGP